MTHSAPRQDPATSQMSGVPAEPSPLARTLMWPTVRRNLVLALVVGSVLNAINQGGALVAMAGITWWQLALNFCVPFLVASFGSWNSLRGGTPGKDAGDREKA